MTPARDEVRGGTTARGLAGLLALSGTDLGVTEWRVITQDQVDSFADATGDHQWIHTDPERAATGPFGGTIAHGYLTLSLLIPLFGELLVIEDVAVRVNYGLEKVRFPAPVPVGGRVRMAGTVAAAEEVRGGVQLLLDFTVELADSDKPVCVARAVYRYYA
ncbi:MaoC family dehydratase [Actinophytocola sediminis]